MGPLGRCPEGLGNYSGLNLPGHFGAYADMNFPTDMGIRSIAAFAWTPFMQYFESHNDMTFLQQQAYPYLRGIVDFYSDYLKLMPDGKLHVLHSCGDEICMYEDGEGEDPMEDLTFARMAFNKAVKYSELLGVDQGLRPHWAEAAHNLALYPLTTVAVSPDVPCYVWN